MRFFLLSSLGLALWAICLACDVVTQTPCEENDDCARNEACDADGFCSSAVQDDDSEDASGDGDFGDGDGDFGDGDGDFGDGDGDNGDGDGDGAPLDGGVEEPDAGSSGDGDGDGDGVEPELLKRLDDDVDQFGPDGWLDLVRCDIALGADASGNDRLEVTMTMAESFPSVVAFNAPDVDTGATDFAFSVYIDLDDQVATGCVPGSDALDGADMVIDARRTKPTPPDDMPFEGSLEENLDVDAMTNSLDFGCSFEATGFGPPAVVDGATITFSGLVDEPPPVQARFSCRVHRQSPFVLDEVIGD